MQVSGRNWAINLASSLSSVVETAPGLIAFTIFLYRIVTPAP